MTVSAVSFTSTHLPFFKGWQHLSQGVFRQGFPESLEAGTDPKPVRDSVALCLQELEFEVGNFRILLTEEGFEVYNFLVLVLQHDRKEFAIEESFLIFFDILASFRTSLEGIIACLRTLQIPFQLIDDGFVV